MTDPATFVLTQPDFRKARLPSLYSDFTSLQTSNPEGYTANATAWKTALSQAALAGLLPGTSGHTDRLLLSCTPSLSSHLAIPDFGIPPALGTVVNDGLLHGEFMVLKEFLGREASIFYKPWIDPWKVMSWGLRQVGIGGGGAIGGKMVRGEVVIMRNVEEISKIVIQAKSRQQQARQVDRVLTLDTLEHEVAALLGPERGLSERDLKVLVKYITRDLGEATLEGKTIKFKNPDGQLEPITQSDITTAQLKHMILTQNLRIAALSSKVTSLQQTAKSAAMTNNKVTALSSLRSKKMTEDHLQQAYGSLSSLENVLMKIEQAVDNAQLVATLEASSGVLQKLNKETGGVERVEEVMDHLAEQMQETDEISRAVGETGAIKMDEVESEVQEEFERMLREEEEEKQKIADAEALKKMQEAEREKQKEAELDAALAQRLAGLNVGQGEPVGASPTSAQPQPATSTATDEDGRQQNADREALPA